ncbi:MAG: GTP cyclohydrolase I FolE2, partial [Solirubrobacteraceae bacterium]|nr:GTP cyclohydrolase I FolE2 [Solirubrobacteraceae bacterium]
RQENLETIHQHNVIATRVGLLGELRAEIRGDQIVPQHLGRDTWLAGA